jgi:hypothetical protein
VLLHLLLVRSARYVHNPNQGWIHCNCNCAILNLRLITYRAKVLGRKLLSGNTEVAFPSTTAPTTGPPVSATGVTASANVTSVDSTYPATGAASTVSVSAVDIAATPTIGQKRKAF